MYSRMSLIEELVAVRLHKQISSLIEITRQGFDVAVRCHPEMLQVVHSELEKATAQEVSLCVYSSIEAYLARAGHDERNAAAVVTNDPLPSGCALITVELPPIEEMLPSLATTVMTILKHMRLENYVDVFDGAKLTRLRDILKRKGLPAFLDAVVHVAFHAGLEGDEREAQRILDHIVQSTASQSNESFMNELSSAEVFFRKIISENKHPHGFLKVALSFFVVHGMGNSLSAASRILKISRTTLQEHMRLASDYGVEKLFRNRQLVSEATH